MLWTMTFWIRRVAMDTRILIRKEAQSVHKFLTYVCYSSEIAVEVITILPML